MKKALLLLTIVFTVFGTHAQQLHNERRTVVFKYTADWCPPCGEWGWDIHDSLYSYQKSDSNYKAYTIAVHDQSDQLFLNSSIGALLAATTKPVQVSSFPSFVVDNNDMVDMVDWLDFDTSFNIVVTRAVDSIEKYIGIETAQQAVAGVGLEARITTTDSLYVKTKVQFLQNASGDYRLAVYVIEDSVMAFQDQQAGAVPHHLVLREPMETNAWGYSLPGGPFLPNQQFTYTYKMQIPNGWNTSHLYYMIVLYKVDVQNVTAEVENVYMTNKTTNTTTSIEELGIDMVAIYPNPARNFVNLRLPVNSSCTVYLTDLVGKKMENLFNGNITANESKSIALPQHLSSGVYLIHVKTPSETFSSKISIIKE